MRGIIATIIFIFILINLGVLGMFYAGMGDGHSFLCSSFLAGDCPADSGSSMFAIHYLSIMKSLAGTAASGTAMIFALLLIVSILFLFYNNITGANLGAMMCRPQKWADKIFHHQKLLRWIAFHNKGDDTVRFGLTNYSYV